MARSLAYALPSNYSLLASDSLSLELYDKRCMALADLRLSSSPLCLSLSQPLIVCSDWLTVASDLAHHILPYTPDEIQSAHFRAFRIPVQAVLAARADGDIPAELRSVHVIGSGPPITPSSIHRATYSDPESVSSGTKSSSATSLSSGDSPTESLP